MVLVDEGDEELEAGVGGGEGTEAGELGVVALAGASGEACIGIGWDEKFCAGAQMPLEFGQKNVDAGKVEVAEMQVAVGDGAEPGNQVCGLRIARNEQDRGAQMLEKVLLRAGQAEVFHILHPDYHNIGRNLERAPVADEEETLSLIHI